jgi:hypothetical protein
MRQDIKWDDNPNRQERRRRFALMRMSRRVRKEKESGIVTCGAFGSFKGKTGHPKGYLYKPQVIRSIPRLTPEEIKYEDYLKE